METSLAPVVAVIGGGQLARMMAEEASPLGMEMRALVEAPDGSTAQVLPTSPVGAADDEEAVRRLMEGADVLTFEHEHQDDTLLRSLEQEGVSVQPSASALLLARDKLAMRRAMSKAGIPQPAWCEATGDEAAMRAAITDFAAEHGWPIVLKTPRGGYDGHGVLLVRDAAELTCGEAAQWIAAAAAASAGREDVQAGGGGSLGGARVTSLLVEQAVPFSRELAVLLARSPRGEIASWPVVESIQENGVCSVVLAPAPDLEEAARAQAQEIGRTIAERFGVTGVLAVELFAVEVPGQPTHVLVNELAMRPHNSGHWTQDGAITSQFAQHLRAVADLPLGSPELVARGAVMVNFLGGPVEPGRDTYLRAVAAEPQAHIHLYGKAWRPGRKLGHVTMVLPGDPSHPASREDLASLRAKASSVVGILRGEA